MRLNFAYNSGETYFFPSNKTAFATSDSKLQYLASDLIVSQFIFS